MIVRLCIDTNLDGTPRLLVGETSFALGDELDGRFGFDDCRLGRDLLHIILALAIRKQGEPGAWVSADELGVLARAGASGSSTAKLLELALCARPPHKLRLIEFGQSRPPGHRFRGGRSRGPYRLGADIDVSRFDAATALAVLTGVTDPDLSCELDDGMGLLTTARTKLNDGQFTHGKRIVDAALAALYRNSPMPSGGSIDHAFALAEAKILLANIDLELGRSEQGLRAAVEAQALFDRLHHPLRLAYALEVEAHLRGQLNSPEEAVRSIAAARRALVHLDNGPRSARKGVSRAKYVGTMGWRLAAAGRFAPADRRLRSALRMAMESGSEEWTGIWAFRIAQNAIAMKDLANAEQHLEFAFRCQNAMSVSGTAALARAATEFNLAAGKLDEAERWLCLARSIGRAHNMGHQDRCVAALLKKLETLR